MVDRRHNNIVLGENKTLPLRLGTKKK